MGEPNLVLPKRITRKVAENIQAQLNLYKEPGMVIFINKI